MNQKHTSEHLEPKDSASACGITTSISLPCLELRARIAGLTKAQLEVLEQVALRRTSKEIARQLGISPVTVDQRIKRAQLVLGAASRSEAARMLIAARTAAEQPILATYDKTIYDSSGLSECDPTGKMATSFGEWNPASGSDTSTMRQTQSVYNAGMVGGKAERPWSLVLEDIRRSGHLSNATKTAIIVAIAILTVIVLALLVSLAEGISRII